MAPFGADQSSCAPKIALLWNNPAHATAGISPPATPFIGSGGGNIVNGTEIWACQWSWTMQSGPSIGGSPARNWNALLKTAPDLNVVP